MNLIKKLVEFLKPFRDLIVIVTALIAAGYAAITYFATSEQLAKAEADLKQLQTTQHDSAISALKELKCVNGLNRELIRAELEEFRVSTLLRANVADSERLRGRDDADIQIILANLTNTRETLIDQLRGVSEEKQAALKALRENHCAGTT